MFAFSSVPNRVGEETLWALERTSSNISSDTILRKLTNALSAGDSIYSDITKSMKLLKKGRPFHVRAGIADAGISMPDEACEVIFAQGIPLVDADTSESADQEKKPEHNLQEVRESKEPVHSATDADIASETGELQQQTMPHVEEGEMDLLDQSDGVKPPEHEK